MAIRIEQVDAGSEAEALGLAPGDELLSVDDTHRAAAGTLKGKRVSIPHDLVTVIRESTVRVLLHRSLSHPAWEGGSGR